MADVEREQFLRENAVSVVNDLEAALERKREQLARLENSRAGLRQELRAMAERARNAEAENERLRGQAEWLKQENEGLRKGFEPALELARLENERLRLALQRIIRAWDAERPEGGEWTVPAAVEDARKLLDGEG